MSHINDEDVLRIVQWGEVEEYVATVPSLKKRLYDMRDAYNILNSKAKEFVEQHSSLNNKEFAQEALKHRSSHLLFTLRKGGSIADVPRKKLLEYMSVL